MITFRRTSWAFRRTSLDGVEYALMELPGYGDVPTLVTCAARVDGHQVRLGEWEQVDADTDEARARELIAEHRDSLLGRPASAAA